jgi:hypothetical protein
MVGWMRLRRHLLLIAAALSVPVARSQDAAEIVRKSVERDARNFARLKDYTLTQRDEMRIYNRSGKLQSTRSGTYEIVILEGQPYARKIAENDRPLSEKEAQRERDKMDREFRKRQKESASDKARLEKQRTEERRFLAEVPRAFNLKVEGTEAISGKPAWIVSLEPKPDYRPVNSRAKLLTKVRAKLWIDQAEYQWVRVDAEVLDTISFGLSLIRIAPGSHLHFEQTRVNDEVWLPSVLAVSAGARLGYVKKMRAEFDVSYRDYKKFQTDSHIVGVEEQ